MFKKRGQIAINKETIINALIVIAVIILVGVFFYSIMSGKMIDAIEYLKNLLRFGR